jgi:hypothetical protein
MRIGIDFDNTIACYDGAFHAAALVRGLIPPELARDKTSVREHLRARGQDSDFTLLQGYVYGPGMAHAAPFPGLVECLLALRAAGHSLVMVSHRTREPFAGPAYDLHEAARSFLARHGLLNGEASPLREADVWLELTKEAKIARIAALACDVFIDDLPEILAMPGFPPATQRILFDPEGHYPDGVWKDHRFARYALWSAIGAALLDGAA